MKARMLYGVLLIAFGTGWMTGPTAAHHSLAAFDRTKPITLDGVISQAKWMNPHSWIYLDVKDKDGKVTNWGMETVSPAQFAQRVSPSLLKPGVRMTAIGIGPKDPAQHIMALQEFIIDGKKYNSAAAAGREGAGQ
ncbi:MAG: DUF6152 family protein [Acidobacteriota bacterium]